MGRFSRSRRCSRHAVAEAEEARATTSLRRPQLLELAPLHGREGQAHPTLDSSRQRQGSRSTTSRTINYEREYFAKVQGPLRPGRRHRPRHLRLRPTTRASRGSTSTRVGCRSSTRAGSRTSPTSSTRRRALRSTRSASTRCPWLSGMTGIAWNEELTGPGHSRRPALRGPEAQGEGHHASARWPTRWDSSCWTNGDDPGAVTDESFDRALAADPGCRRLGPDRQVHGQRLRPATGARGTFAAAVAWSGDVIQLSRDNPKLKWAIPEKGGIIWTDNMLIPTGGSVPTASKYMNFVYDPKIAAPRSPSATSYIIRRQGRQGRGREDRPGLGEQPADLPGRRDALTGPSVRPSDAQQRGLHHEVAGGPRSVGSVVWSSPSIGTKG